MDNQQKIYEYIFIIDYSTERQLSNDKIKFDLNEITNNINQKYEYNNENINVNENDINYDFVESNNIISLFIYTDLNKYSNSNEYKTTIELNEDLLVNDILCKQLNNYILEYIQNNNIIGDINNFILENYNQYKKFYIKLKFNKKRYYSNILINAIRDCILENVIYPSIDNDQYWNEDINKELKQQHIKNLLGYE